VERINIHNYEAYLLDFSEGNLSDECQMELELFLIQHPKFNIDLAELSLVAIENEPINFSNKNNLKKSETDLVSENQFISYIENQLSAKERLLVEKGCATNSWLSKELTLYKNTIVSEDKSIIFNQKQSLKRNPRVIWFNFSATQFAAAASVLFLIGLFIFWPKPETTNSQLADKIINEIPKKSIPNNLNSPTQNIAFINAKEKNNSKANNVSLINAHFTLAKSTTVLPNEPMVSSFKDSVINLTIDNSAIEHPNNENLISQNAPIAIKENGQAVVQVITENDGESTTINTDKNKKGIWTTFSRALKNLNQIGVKSVNGDEEKNKENTSYALTLGAISITHKAGNL
jgi:hypothetical protein